MHPLTDELHEALVAFDARRPGSAKEIEAVVEKIDKALMRPPLWGTSQVASHLGVRDSNIDKVAGLPEPAVKADRGRLWHPFQVRALKRRRTRRRTETKT